MSLAEIEAVAARISSRPRQRAGVLERLLRRRRINPDTGCWEWTGCIFKTSGYGQINIEKKPTTVQRAMAHLVLGPSPLYACHACDNPLCFNPEHLFYGTALDNMRDAVRKGRTATGDRNGLHRRPELAARGERAGGARLTTEQVIEIRHLYRRGVYGLKRLARQFGTTDTNVLHIVRRDTWRHVP